MNVRHAGVLLLLVVVGFCAWSSQAVAQPADPLEGRGLCEMVPPEAFFYVERRGHEAVRKAFAASNLGEMARDEAINQFVHATRVRIGKMIVKGMFDLNDEDEIARHHKLLHGLLKPFWYKPCAAFVLPPEKGASKPGFGFVCLPGKYHKECKTALDALMKKGLPEEGKAGTRQTFTYKSGFCAWQGVAKSKTALFSREGHGEFLLPDDPKERIEMLKKRRLFMVSWVSPVLYIATDLRTADAIGRVFGPARNRKTRKDSPAFQHVMRKTVMKDWAFKWYLDVEMLLKSVGKDRDLPGFLKALGVHKIRGVGGTGGYADKVYTRKTYIYAPKARGGLVRIFKRGGDYKRAFAATPGESTFCLAGQLDTDALLKMVEAIVIEREKAMGRQKERVRHERVMDVGEVVVVEEGELQPHPKEPQPRPKAPQPQPKKVTPTTAPAPVKISEKSAKILKQLKLLAEASDGSATIFVTDLQAMMMGMMGRGGMPVGAVLCVKDGAKAAKVIDEMVNEAIKQNTRGGKAPEVQTKAYRKIPIRLVGDMFNLAVMKDRVVIAMGDSALKAAIDTALDSTGGFEPDSKGEKLTKLAGKGSGIFKVDLAAIAKTFWPLLMGLSQRVGEDFHLASMPSTNKLVRMLGPEVAVFEPDDEGLLLKSRGKVPFATKFAPGFQFVGYFIFIMF